MESRLQAYPRTLDSGYHTWSRSLLPIAYLGRLLSCCRTENSGGCVELAFWAGPHRLSTKS